MHSNNEKSVYAYYSLEEQSKSANRFCHVGRKVIKMSSSENIEMNDQV